MLTSKAEPRSGFRRAGRRSLRAELWMRREGQNCPRSVPGAFSFGGLGLRCRSMRRLCVFCGSNPGHNPAYRALAEEVGGVLARKGIGIVYGGGRIGLMGALADAA